MDHRAEMDEQSYCAIQIGDERNHKFHIPTPLLLHALRPLLLLRLRKILKHQLRLMFTV